MLTQHAINDAEKALVVCQELGLGVVVGLLCQWAREAAVEEEEDEISRRCHVHWVV